MVVCQKIFHNIAFDFDKKGGLPSFLKLYCKFWGFYSNAFSLTLYYQPHKMVNTLKRFFHCRRRIFWVFLTILWGLPLKEYISEHI